MAQNKSSIYFGVLFFLLIILPISYANANINVENSSTNDSLNVSSVINNLNIKLLSNKINYNVGEDVNLSIVIQNKNDFDIDGKIRGKIIVGDVGFDIECFEYLAKANSTEQLRLSPIPATLSNSNTKMMSTLYSCDNKQLTSVKTFISNKALSQTGSEEFELGPFNYSFVIDNKEYNISSNVLKIKVSTNNNQQTKSQTQSSQTQNSNSNSQQNSPSQSSSQNTQQQTTKSSGSNQNGQSHNSNLNTNQKQALTNNQDNSQTVNQLKKQIQNAKANPFNTNMKTKEKENFWLWLLILLSLIIISFIVYKKYINNQDQEDQKEIEIIENKKDEKRYLKLLDEVSKTSDYKKKVSLISRSLREFIKEQKNIKKDITNIEAMNYTNNDYFLELFNEFERIEFANYNKKLDIEKIVKELRKIYQKSMKS